MAKFLIECYNVLLNIRHKYENSELIAGQLDLTLKNQFHAPVNDTDSVVDTHVHQSICVLEIANMIGSITNVLNFELKSLALKQAQIVELN